MAGGDVFEAAVVVVQAADRGNIVLSVPSRVLLYQLVSEPLPGGVSCRMVAETPDTVSCEVEAACGGLEGGFRLHALNRFLARELVRLRPRAVLLRGLDGCVLDLVRVASFFRVPVLLEVAAGMDIEPSPWLLDCMGRLTALVHQESLPPAMAQMAPQARHLQHGDLNTVLEEWCTSAAPLAAVSFDYSLYEFLLRDPPLLMRMQAPHARLFSGCHRVLDVGCGAGLFLQLLGEAGIPASGVERNPVIAEYGRGMGLDITTADALEFLEGDARFDGVYCSHFVEHLPIDGVERLLQGIARALLPGGVAVLVFPDPESIRSQLLGFWRDPEHVRFYHPELVETLAMLFGLELEWSSYHAQPHDVVPFALEPQALPRAEAQPLAPSSSLPAQGWWSRAMTRLGFVPGSRVAELEGRLANMESLLTSVMQDNNQTVAALDERTRHLWAVNRTWAWSDNAVLKLRKRPSPEVDNA
ncbi:class I SAM-dependent methyltransferase [Haliea sp. E1-2-M8]|uniref:class I SAM-dependent methyltransferase n=1 Tax=Haliea sp. E1-2-M8 TaxID=3064706 RepID=UPI0027172358|nr:class I SAM-dependent methyltransferase [Haliea sp. E1-2-M8]MDO8862517.1 class I SAM-dependent methyltransferase [Haliea sp. E1-2-M8]